MGNNIQKIIFELDEDTNAGEVISEILEKNGALEESPDDANYSVAWQRIITVNTATKDLFEKKITEKEMQDLFKSQFKITEEMANGIIKGIKENLLPFAKKITIREEKQTIAEQK